MKRLIAIFLCLAFAFSLVACNKEEVPKQPENEDTRISAGKTFYVSTDGDDVNDGSKEMPLATFTGAIETVRKYKAENGLPDGGIEVIFAKGTYSISTTVKLTAEDSGEEGKPIVYRAENGDEVIFDGGVTLDGSAFVPAAGAVLDRVVNEDAKKSLVMIDLAAAGCYDLVDADLYDRSSDPFRQELFVDNERQQVARWPNAGEYGTDGFRNNNTNNVHYEIPEEKYELWKDVDNMRYFGSPEIDWVTVDLNETEIAIDDETKTFVILDREFEPSEHSTISVYNLPEELDIPGEYYWDTETNYLYYYPKEDLSGKKISFSQIKEHMFFFEEAQYITFENLIFENGRASAIYSMTGDQTHTHNNYFNLKDCTIRCMGTYGLWLFGEDITIESNEFYQLGSNAVYLRGGDVYNTNYICINNVVTNNDIHDYAQNFKTDNFGVQVSGMGFTISHNHIYNAPHSAIHLSSGETLIEYNHIHDVCRNTADAGAIYIGRHWDWDNNVMRYNYIHDVKDLYNGGSPCGIYLDDMVSDQTVYGNILVDIAGCGITVGGGKYNNVENNLMISCGVPVSTDGRGLGFASDHALYFSGSMWGGLRETKYTTDLMRFYHPQNMLIIEKSSISSIYNIDDPGIGSYNILRGNVAYNCISDLPWQDREYGDIFKDSITTDGVINQDRTVRLYSTVEGNAHYEDGVDIGFTQTDNGCSLSDSSRIYRDIPGFEKIPFDKIGNISK